MLIAWLYDVLPHTQRQFCYLLSSKFEVETFNDNGLSQLKLGQWQVCAHAVPACLQSFYGVYEALFARLAKAEVDAWEKRGSVDGSDRSACSGHAINPPMTIFLV